MEIDTVAQLLKQLLSDFSKVKSLSMRMINYIATWAQIMDLYI